MPKVRKLRVSNPHKRRRKNSRRRNLAEVLIVANGKRRRTRRNRSHARRSRKSNPFGMRRHHVRRRGGHRRSNPGIAGFNTGELLKLAAGAAGGVLGSKYVTQMVLGSSNAGPMGWAAQAAITIALGWAANKFVGKDAAVGVVAGGLGAVALRIYNEQISGTSSSMQGLGDPDMGIMGIGLGEYRAGSLPMPSAFSTPPPPAPIVSRGKRM